MENLTIKLVDTGSEPPTTIDDGEIVSVIPSNSKLGYDAILYSGGVHVLTGGDLISHHKVSSTPTAAAFLEIEEQLLVFLSDGTVLSWQISALQAEPTDAAVMEGGIFAAAFSPGQSECVIVSGSSVVHLLTNTMLQLESRPLDSGSSGLVGGVALGWGQEATQFKGAVGRSAAPDRNVKGARDGEDTGKVVICWRGDGLFVAISYLTEERRQFSIFHGDSLEPFASLEAGTWLEPGFAWRPSGGLLASTIRKPIGYEVSFFEQNGLRHGGFTINENSLIVKTLSWSSDSAILFLHAADLKGNSVILLYTTANYHWYLKQRIAFDCQLLTVNWVEESSNVFYVIHSSGLKEIYSIESHVTRSTGLNEHDISTVAIVDGLTLHLTPFKLANVPPPLSRDHLIFEFPVALVRFASMGDSSRFAVLAGSTIAVHRYAAISQIEMLYTCNVSKYGRIEDMSFENDVVFKTAGVTYRLSNGGDVTEHTNGSSAISTGNWQWCELAAGRQLLRLTELRELVLAETDQVLLSNCSSFAAHRDFVIATTFAHKLVFMPLHDLSDSSLQRAVERGSKILTVTEHSVILRLPRGNLETVQPRALLIAALKRHLSAREYATAFAIMRRQRVNMNLLVDHDPELFIANLSEFLSQVNRCEYVNVFLNELSSENVTKSLYLSHYGIGKSDCSEKVNHVCAALRAVMTDGDKWFLAHLTSFARQQPPKLDDALKLCRGKEEAGLRHLIQLADAAALFDIALATYDLRLVLMVAEASQRDPKEYLPFLNELAGLEEQERRYRIDVHLRHYDTALENLTKCLNSEDRCLALLQEHNLWSTASRLFSRGHPLYQRFCRAHGDNLLGNRSYTEAAIQYAAAGAWDQLIDVAPRSDWRVVVPLLPSGQRRETCCIIAAQLEADSRRDEAAELHELWLGDTEAALGCLLDHSAWLRALEVASRYSAVEYRSRVFASAREFATRRIEELENSSKSLQGYVTRLAVVRALPPRDDWTEEYSGAVGDGALSEAGSLRSWRTGTSTSSRKSRRSRQARWSLKEGSAYEESALLQEISSMIVTCQQQKIEVRDCLITLMLGAYLPLAEKFQNVFLAHQKVCESSITHTWPEGEERPCRCQVDASIREAPSFVRADKSWCLKI